MSELRFSIKASLIITLILIQPHEILSQVPDGIGMRGLSPKVMLGIRTGYDYDAEAWSLGGQGKILLGGGRVGGIQLIPSGDLFFLNGNKDCQFNIDLAMNLLMLYGGVGFAFLNREFQQFDDEYKTGTNYFIGMPLLLPLRLRLPFMPYIEARWTEFDNEQLFRFVIGINFMLSGHR